MGDLSAAINLSKSLVQTEYNRGNFAAVENHFNTIIDKFANSDNKLLAVAYNNRGHARYLQVRFTEAEADYDEAVRLDRSLAVAYYNRGTVRYRMGDMEGAGRDLRRAVELEPENGEFREGLKSCSS